MEKNIGNIYLLQLCNEKNEKFYKIGKSKNIDIRLKNYTFKNILLPNGCGLTKIISNYEEIKLSKEDEETRNKQIDILKLYIKTNFSHIEII